MESVLMDIHLLQEFTLLFTNYLFLNVGTLFNTLLLKSVKYQQTALFLSLQTSSHIPLLHSHCLSSESFIFGHSEAEAKGSNQFGLDTNGTSPH